jgi:peptide/nickel transport system ATP-binding protein
MLWTRWSSLGQTSLISRSDSGVKHIACSQWFAPELDESVPVPNPHVQRARRTAVGNLFAPLPDDKTMIRDEQCIFAPRCAWTQPKCWSERPLLRPAYANGLVACHRYPEWRNEIAKPRPLDADVMSARSAGNPHPPKRELDQHGKPSHRVVGRPDPTK